MSRAERLLALMQLLRLRRSPVAGAELAAELGVSLRTLYRDIAALQAQGARIEGEAGVGYVLRPGYFLPPLMFTEEEVQALALGARWVVERADSGLGEAAAGALEKIAAVLPGSLLGEMDSPGLLVAPGSPAAAGDADMFRLRWAIRAERKLRVAYRDLKDRETERTLWPLALGYFQQVRILVAWCELRQAFRHFRTDRILGLEILDAHLPRRRAALLAEWRQSQGIPDPAARRS
ncbi:MAG: YafY family protein [Thermodesulfobacteriota bacterium]